MFIRTLSASKNHQIDAQKFRLSCRGYGTFIDASASRRYKKRHDKASTSMPEPEPRITDIKRIQTLFEQRRPSYGLDEAAELLGISSNDIQYRLDEDTVTALHLPGEVRIAWADVILLGLLYRWTFQLITEALEGSSAEALLPAPVHTTPGTLVLPRYQWTVLDLLASERQREQGRTWSASDVVDEALRAYFLEGEWENLERQSPGIRAAMEWPANDMGDATT